MGDACGGIFAASHGFLASSRINYLLAVIVATLLISQIGFLAGGGARLLRATHLLKKSRGSSAARPCPALAKLLSEDCAAWSQRLIIDAGSDSLEAQTIGLLKPRILLSGRLVSRLSGEELRAVVLHEQAHCQGHDNLLVSLTKPVALTLFYVPGIRLAFREMCAALEKSADRQAASKAGALVVAGALAHLAKAGIDGRTEAVAPGLALNARGNGELASRLKELVEQPQPRRHCGRLALFVLATVAALAIFSSSALAVVGHDQRDAFICFTEHQDQGPGGAACDLDHH